MPITVNCAWCEKEIERHPHRLRNGTHQFCCSEHRIKWMATVKGVDHWLYKREKRTCLYCGNEFEACPSEKKKFCNLACYYAFKKLRNKCIVCGKEVKRSNSSYCSRKCMGIDRQNRIEKNCNICGRSFFVRPCEDKGKRNVCSKKCSDIQKYKNYKYSDEEMEQYLVELKERISRIPSISDLKSEMACNEKALHWALYTRRGGLRYWQEKLFGKTSYCFKWESTCIDIFNKVLDYPEFKTQKTFSWLKHYDNGKKRAGVLRIDLFYPQYNLCIEFDGEGHYQQINWKKGAECLEDIQKRDRLKNKLIQEHGLKLLRFRFDEPLTGEHVKERLNQFINLS